MKLEMKQAEMRETKLSLEVEKEQTRQELLARLRELETMADRLKRSEQQLRDAQQEAQQYERRNEEYSSGLAEVRQKVCGFSFWLSFPTQIICDSFSAFFLPPRRWSSRALTWRRSSRRTCCSRRRTVSSKRRSSTWRGTDTRVLTVKTRIHATNKSASA